MVTKTMMGTNSVFRGRHLGLAALVLAQWATLACGKSSVQAAPATPASLVSVVKASAQDVPRYLDEIGRNDPEFHRPRTLRR
jgi:multidrug efflux pump subunit AcrA (membrane-fusion protein)